MSTSPHLVWTGVIHIRGKRHGMERRCVAIATEAASSTDWPGRLECLAERVKPEDVVASRVALASRSWSARVVPLSEEGADSKLGRIAKVLAERGLAFEVDWGGRGVFLRGVVWGGAWGLFATFYDDAVVQKACGLVREMGAPNVLWRGGIVITGLSNTLSLWCVGTSVAFDNRTPLVSAAEWPGVLCATASCLRPVDMEDLGRPQYEWAVRFVPVDGDDVERVEPRLAHLVRVLERRGLGFEVAWGGGKVVLCGVELAEGLALVGVFCRLDAGAGGC